jgi:hypothetical protein
MYHSEQNTPVSPPRIDMLTLLTIAAILPSLVVSAPAAAPVSPCAAVHIIAARASTEPPGAGTYALT